MTDLTIDELEWWEMELAKYLPKVPQVQQGVKRLSAAARRGLERDHLAGQVTELCRENAALTEKLRQTEAKRQAAEEMLRDSDRGVTALTEKLGRCREALDRIVQLNHPDEAFRIARAALEEPEAMTPEEKELTERAWSLFHKLTDDNDKGVITDLLYHWGWCQAGAEELPKYARVEALEDAARVADSYATEDCDACAAAIRALAKNK